MTVEEILAALQAIIDEAGGADQPLTDEQVEQYEALEVQLKAARKRESLRDRHEAYTMVTTRPGVASPSKRPAESLNKAFGAYLRTGRPNQDIEQLRSHEPHRFTNAQSEGVPSEGGYLVPDEFREKLIERMKAYGGIADVADEFTTGDGRPVNWPTIDDTANIGEIVEENGTFSSGADLAFGENGMGAYSYMAGGGGSTPIRVSRELAQDAAFDLEGLVSRLLGMRIGRIQAQHLATGTGVMQPLGLVTGLTGIELIADTAGITYDDLVNFVHSVDPAYRGPNCKWVFNDTMLRDIKKLKDSHGDPYVLTQRDLSQSVTYETLLGYPVKIDQALPTMVANNNSLNWGAFGDIKAGYIVRRVKEVELLVNPYSRMANRQIEYTAWARMDATQQDTNAYVALTGEA